ncbi:MAG: EamA family transporter, partial [Bacteroidetes bacterium]|nr:EamA family transporter [Bacteroidota bacterium]
TAKSAGALLYLVLLGSLVGYTAYIWLLKVSTPAKVSTYAYVNPLVAVFFGWLFAAEPISLRTVLAVGLIVSGVAIITLRKMVVANIRRWRVPSTAKNIAIIESERIS